MITVAIVFILFIVFYFYSTRTFKYWEKKGVKYDKPLPLFGNNILVYTLQKSIADSRADLYWKYPDERLVGFYQTWKPELVLRDPELVKRVLVTDFAYFYPRGLKRHHTVTEPMLRNLFFADGDLWRLLRQRMTGAFTSGKLRAMFPLIIERTERLVQCALSARGTLDARDLMARYTTDFIGACGFGLNSDSLRDENSAFRKLGIKIFDTNLAVIAIVILKELFPETFKYAKTLGDVEKDLVLLVNEILRQRNHKPSGRHDFIDLLLEAQQKGTMVCDSLEKLKSDGTPELAKLELTDELIAAQVFVFFAAGFETSSSATSFTLHQLAYHPEVQKKVQQEIDTVLARYDNKLCYDAVKEMTYLEWTFKEAMRMFPSLGYLLRECAKTYTFPEINLTIDKGVRVFIPLQAMHNDPKYFDNPKEFRPERFHSDNFDSKYKFVYMPFGEGPRACIGARLGLMQSLAGLAAVLSRCSVSPAPTTVRWPKVNPRSGVVQSIQGGLPLLFHERKTTQ